MRSPYPRYTASSVITYVRSLPGGGTATLTGEVVGQTEVGGQSFDRFQVGDLTGTTSGGVEVVGRLVDEGHIEVVSGQYQAGAASGLSIPVYGAGVMPAPVRIAIEPPLGQQQEVSFEGSATIGSSGAASEPSSITASYVLEEKDVSVETPMGMLAGCNRFSARATVPLVFGVSVPIEGDIWVSPQLGLVKAEMSEPLAGLGISMASTTDSSDLGGGWMSVQRIGVIGQGADASFKLSTYDRAGALDADKDTHAKMLLEVRWLDDAKAKTSDRPFVEEQLGTLFGYFPETLQASPVSFFHPEENGQGYTHWITFVDQAAKNEAQNGIAYQINVDYEPTFSPVRITARIVYKLAPAADR